MSKEAYPRYKPSGVEWLGDVPEHWDFHGLKRICRLAYGEALASDNRGDGEIPVYGSNGPVGAHNHSNAIAPCIVVGRKGSFGKVQYSEAPVFAIDTTYFVDARFSNVNLRWLYYALTWVRLDDVSKDSAVPGLDREDAYGRRLPTPPPDEQRSIAAFLDRETARIDLLIAKKQRQIELLQEKRAALISHAVTKGLNHSVKMKDSGIEWLGEVPAYWLVVRLGYFARVRNGSTPSRTHMEYWMDGDVPWLSSSKVNEDIITEPSEWITETARLESGLEVVPAGSVVIGLVGQGRTRGMSALMATDAAINQNMAAIIPRSRLVGRYVHYLLQHMYEPIREGGRGANQPALNCELIAGLRVLLLPLNEQQVIAEHLDRVSEDVSSISTTIEHSVALLREYRIALISAAVTGKIDVRQEVA
ncbi:MAG: restriction endonuclease subunit S [Candidatus Tectomicrobia bacterium]|nr:restriction endonuclease subunit S [Candidatus Tectomicrobia bacterium]